MLAVPVAHWVGSWWHSLMGEHCLGSPSPVLSALHAMPRSHAAPCPPQADVTRWGHRPAALVSREWGFGSGSARVLPFLSTPSWLVSLRHAASMLPSRLCPRWLGEPLEHAGVLALGAGCGCSLWLCACVCFAVFIGCSQPVLRANETSVSLSKQSFPSLCCCCWSAFRHCSLPLSLSRSSASSWAARDSAPPWVSSGAVLSPQPCCVVWGLVGERRVGCSLGFGWGSLFWRSGDVLLSAGYFIQS